MSIEALTFRDFGVISWVTSHWHILKWYLSDHLINFYLEKYGSSAFKCRIANIFSNPGCKDPSYRMKKVLIYIWKYFLKTCGYRFYTLLFLKWLHLMPKGQQKLRKFSNLIEVGLSFHQLFLELPETFWSLQNSQFISKSPKTSLLSFLGLANFTSCLIYIVWSKS